MGPPRTAYSTRSGIIAAIGSPGGVSSLRSDVIRAPSRRMLAKIRSCSWLIFFSLEYSARATSIRASLDQGSVSAPCQRQKSVLALTTADKFLQVSTGGPRCFVAAKTHHSQSVFMLVLRVAPPSYSSRWCSCGLRRQYIIIGARHDSPPRITIAVGCRAWQ